MTPLHLLKKLATVQGLHLEECFHQKLRQSCLELSYDFLSICIVKLIFMLKYWQDKMLMWRNMTDSKQVIGAADGGMITMIVSNLNQTLPSSQEPNHNLGP